MNGAAAETVKASEGRNGEGVRGQARRERRLLGQGRPRYAVTEVTDQQGCGHGIHERRGKAGCDDEPGRQ